jgi:hypothetical protein
MGDKFMLRLSLLSLLVLSFVVGCSTIQVKSDFNPKTDFSRLKTYRWLNNQDKPSDDIRINNEFVINAVRAAVEKDLQGKGFTRVDNDQADFVIAWFGAIEQKIKSENINHFYAPYGYGTLYRDPYWNSQPTTINVGEYEQGSLIFDFLDPGSHTLLWRGIGSDKLKDDQSESQVTQNIKAAVTQVLAGFPPQ